MYEKRSYQYYILHFSIIPECTMVFYKENKLLTKKAIYFNFEMEFFLDNIGSTFLQYQLIVKACRIIHLSKVAI